MFFIGTVRHRLFIGGFGYQCWWNGFVRDITARLEGTWLIRSKS